MPDDDTTYTWSNMAEGETYTVGETYTIDAAALEEYWIGDHPISLGWWGLFCG